MNIELITLFESTLPKDLQLPISEKLSAEDKKGKEVVKQFLFGDAAINYFELHLRPVLEKYIEMIEQNENKPFDAGLFYSREVVMKYLNILDDSDPLRIRYNKSKYFNVYTDLKDIGLF
jgi:hypothetical protein